MSKILVNSLDKIISNRLSEFKVKKDFNKLVSNFIDVNVEILQNPAPQYRLFFSDARERNPVYRLFDLEQKDVEDLVDKIPFLDSNWKVAKDPFFIIMTLMIRELTKKNNDKTTLKNAMLYLSFSMYSSLQYKYFRFPPNEDIINYTINNISNKFLFKSYGSVLKAIEHTVEVNHNKYKKDLLSTEDKDIINYLINLRNRFNGLIQNFKNAYEENRKNKNYLSHETDNMDEDNYKETSNISGDIKNTVSDLTIKFFTATINENIVRMTATVNHIDKSTLYNVVELIKENESNLVSEIISYIIEIFLTEYNGNISMIKSKKFIADGIGIYSRSNTKDIRIIRSKEILEILLTKYCKRFIETERLVTKNNYKKALFSYFVFFIAYNA